MFLSKKRRSTLRLVWLESFIAAAEHLSVTKAAEALNTAQSTVSRDLADLDAWLGRALSTNDTPFVLSSSGKSFLPTAKTVVAMLDDARAKPGNAIKHTLVSAADIKL